MLFAEMRVNQIEQGEQENPDNIDKVPIESCHLHRRVPLWRVGSTVSLDDREQQQPGASNDGARVGGMMTYSTTYSQDGASATNREFGGSQALQGLESVGEVRIETSTGNAKSSTPASVIVSTRSGTNRY